LCPDYRRNGIERLLTFARRLNPLQVRLLLEPDQLTLGVLAVLAHDQRARIGLVTNAVQMLQRLAIHETGERQRCLRNAPSKKPADLVEQAARELLIHSPADALRHLLARDPQRERRNVVLRQRRCRLREVLGQRPTSDQPHLERAHETFHVARLDAPRGCGIDRRKPAVQPFGAAPGRHLLQTPPQRFVPRGPFEQPSRQRAVIEARAADQNGKPPAGGDSADHRRSFARVAGRRVLVGRFHHVHHVMRNAPLLERGNLVRADVEAAVHGRRIAAHDLAAELLGDRDAEGALPRRGRADNRDQRRPRAHRQSTRANVYTASAVRTTNSPTCCARVGFVIRTADFR
jgi:hypothetical protein